jgi:hypothetical protein
MNNGCTATFQLKAGVALYGGFAGDETAREQRDWELNVTVLSGDIDGDDVLDAGNVYHVVSSTGLTETARLDGFAVTAGNANGYGTNSLGGGMFNQDSSPSLDNIIFGNNQATNWGGGMYNTSSAPSLDNVTFRDNQAKRGGGMANGSSSDPTMHNVAFSDNKVSIQGGGMYNHSSNPSLENVIFSDNLADSQGGGMYNYVSSPALTNVTFSSNRADAGGGMLNYTNSNPTLVNCILWGNSAPTAPEIYNGGSSNSTITYSDIQGGYTGTGNIDADPLFVAPASGDYRLGAGSPAINAGDNSAVTTATDLDGNPRIVNGSVDMGAYEVQ